MTLSLKNRPANAKTVKIINPHTRVVQKANIPIKELNLSYSGSPQEDQVVPYHNNSLSQCKHEPQDSHADAALAKALSQDQPQVLHYREMHDVEKAYFTLGNLGERFDLPNTKNDSDEDEGNDEGSKDKDYVNLIELRFLSRKLRAAQTHEETLIEFLFALASQDLTNASAAYKIDKNGCSTYLRAKHVKLRRLLFNNPFLDYFNSLGGTDSMSDDKKWNLWGKAFLESNTRELDLGHTTPEAAMEQNADNPFFITAYKTTRKSNSTAVLRVITTDDIQYWRETFKSFSEFTKAINLLRSWSFVYKNKQWCYNFLFPFGPDCLYDEISKDHVLKNNYLSGAGQLMLSMLQRAKPHEDSLFVLESISQRFLNAHNAFNVLASVLDGHAHDSTYWLDQFKHDISVNNMQPSYGDADDKIYDSFRSTTTIYLPYKKHRVFDQLAQDFKHILEIQNPLNQNDLFHALSRIGMLNIIVYFQETCQRLLEFTGSESNIDMVVECNHDARVSLRRLATLRQHENDALFKRTVQEMFKCYLVDLFPDLDENTVLNAHEHTKVMELLIRFFKFNKHFTSRCTYEKCQNLAAQELAEHDGSPKGQAKVTFGILQKLILATEWGALRNTLSLHRSFGQQIGLSSCEKARSVRYVLSDELVRCLVLTTVDKSKQLMLLDDFLSELNTKYHLVIGPHEAKKYLVSAQATNKNKDESQFTANLDAFKEQLKRLGFLIELSDTASYVKNPYLD